jgi:hypothetical protein
MNVKQSTLALAIVAALPFAAQAAPKVAFSAPLAGAEVNGTLGGSTCEVKGSSDIRRVVFWLDGSTQLNIETGAPWNCDLVTTKYPDGAHKLKAVAYDRNGASTATEIALTFANNSGGTTTPPPTGGTTTPPAGYAGTPYTGTPIAVPGTFEAENFDKGGSNVAYRDLTSGNAGGQYRSADSVDIVASSDSAGGGYVVNYIQSGEWLAYTINVPADGNYEIALRAANKNVAGAGFHAEIDGVDVTGKVAVGATGAWNSFQWFGKAGVPLKAGTHVLKIVADQQYFDVNQVRIAGDGSTPPPPTGGTTPPAYSYAGTPFSGTPIAVPKAFEAEDFDKGGNNVSYRELTATNFGGQYRTADAVDIIASSDAAGGGYAVNYFETGEWLAYTLNVPADGNYDISIRAANKNSTGAAFRAEIDGVDVTGKVAVPSTGSWSSFQWVGKSGVPLKAGKRILKIVADQQYFDVNAISVLAPGTTPPSGGTDPVNQSPTVSFKAPSTGTQLSGLVNSTTCEVNANDDVKVARVEFALGSTALPPKTAAPWQCAIDTTKFADGGYQLKAVAYDEQGKSSSAEVSVAVKNEITSPPASGTKPSSLLFWSGFEGTSAPGPVVDCYGNGCFQEIIGSDSWTGYTWGPKVNNGTARYQMLANSGSNPGPTGIGKYMWNEVQTVTGPKGTPTKVMYSHIAQSGCCGTGSQGGGSTQLPYHIHPGSDVKEMYISQWVKLQPDLSQKMGANNWRTLWETKTTDSDHRLNLYINTDASGKPYWMARADTYVPTHKDYWRVYNSTVPVPVGQWFKLETYFKRSSGSDGRVWMAANGQVIVDKFGSTMGPNNSPINRIMVNQLYSGSTYPIYQWVDNVQVWSTFPTVSSSDGWYDPPYAPR